MQDLSFKACTQNWNGTADMSEKDKSCMPCHVDLHHMAFVHHHNSVDYLISKIQKF